MTSQRTWAAYPANYRAKEMETLADWMRMGVNGSVVGLAGAGKSNLFGYLCYRPEILWRYLPDFAETVVPILIDLNNLPLANQVTLYRAILLAFYEAQARFNQSLQEKIIGIYQENRAALDPFLPYTALRELLTILQAQGTRVILVLDHFDSFCQSAELQTLDTLRGLRDSYKDTLYYFAGLRRELAYLSNSATLGELYELLDSHVCWVGAMSETDARYVIDQQTQAAAESPNEADIARVLSLTGQYPSLLKAACHWWLTQTNRPAYETWQSALLADPRLQYRLAEIWAGLSEAEQFTLAEVQKSRQLKENKAGQPLRKSTEAELPRLAAMGLCHHDRAGWQISSDLLTAYIVQDKARNPDEIWLDEQTGELYQGQVVLTDLSPLARALLLFLVKHPFQRHPKTELIINAWPDELRRDGVTDDSLYQVIKELRKKIEPDPGNPRYLVTWRGRPEGGYQFFPESQARNVKRDA